MLIGSGIIESSMKFTRFRQFAASAALAVAVVFSLGMGMPAAAMSTTPMDGMTHEGTMVSNCTTLHHVAPGTVENIAADKLEEDDDEPSPKPLPYFVQFQKAIAEQPRVDPKDIVRSSSYRPPDIIRLTSNIRF